ncbi:MAG: hypothetical protein D6775_16275 [Caldilineae bacterium]|nr:MAG: hypothetical protein D6775_16275 [Caldilineae bacterium]
MSNTASVSDAGHTPRPPVLLHRIFRGVDGLLAPYRQIDENPARALLSEQALVLFQSMSKADRAHSLRVLHWLQAQGYRQPDLLVAGLLHDCGKAEAKLAVWQRTLKVLLKSFLPRAWFWLARPAAPHSWRYPFYILHIHPQLGAQKALAAGCSELTAWLIAGHERRPDPLHPHYPLMRALQDADGSC